MARQVYEIEFQIPADTATAAFVDEANTLRAALAAAERKIDEAQADLEIAKESAKGVLGAILHMSATEVAASPLERKRKGKGGR